MDHHDKPTTNGDSRLDWGGVLPEARSAMIGLEQVARKAGLPRPLLELVKVRVSQMNGCSYCLDMHTKEARRGGESEQRLYALAAWHETPFFTPRERAALFWAEALTNIAQGVPDTVYSAVSEHFSDHEIVALTSAVVAINAWNRWAISMRTEPGTYRPDLTQ